MRRLPALAAFLALATLAGAGAPPWNEYDTVSENGKFVAQVRRANKNGEKTDPSEDDWSVTVFAAADGKAAGAELWKRPFQYTGDPSGTVLSGDGKAFLTRDLMFSGYRAQVVILLEASREPVVLTGADFSIPPKKLVPGDSGSRWLDDRGMRLDDDGRTLQVTTMGGHQRWIDFGSGRLCGFASGPFRGSLRCDRRVVALGESVKFSFGLLNVSGKQAETWHAAIWPNHRVVLVDAQDNEVRLAGFGQTARRIFSSMSRDKNVQWEVEPGEWDDQLTGDTIERHFVVEKPGVYTLRVEYVDSCLHKEVKVVSNPVEIVFFKDALSSPAEIGERLSDCIARNDRAGVALLVEGGAVSDEDWKGLVAGEKVAGCRAMAAVADAGGSKAEMAHAGREGVKVRVVKGESGWRIAGFALPK